MSRIGITELLILLPILLVSLYWLWMLVDCATNKKLKGSEKIVWILIILLTYLLGALLYSLIRRPKQDPVSAEQEHTKICPQCAETVKTEAKICRFCGYQLDPSWRVDQDSTVQEIDQTSSSISAVASPAQPDNTVTNSGVGSRICPKCGVAMAIRTANQGEYKGKRFYVCPNYSKCKQVVPVDRL